MQVELVTCPVCGSAAGTPVRSVGPYDVHPCPRCGLQFAWPLREPESGWYSGSADYGQLLGVDAAAQLGSAYAGRMRGVPPIERLGPNHLAFLGRTRMRGELLDVGCGEGTFLAVAAQLSDVAGIELDPAAAEAAQSALGEGRVRRLSIWELANHDAPGSYDVITLFEVLEHLEDPVAALGICRTLLRPGGRLVVSVPNRLRRNADSDPIDWPPHHLTRWTSTAIQLAMERAAFRVLRCESLKRSKYGFYESSWIVTGRFPGAFSAVTAGRSVGFGIRFRKLLGLVWIPLWPVYAVRKDPSYGIYAEGVVA